jgi:hypothetical protein
VSFAFPLAAPPAVDLVDDGVAPPAQCPGSLANPQASPGHLCVYESPAHQNATNLLVVEPTLDVASGLGKASRFGFSMRANSIVPGAVRTSGTWALTAP